MAQIGFKVTDNKLQVINTKNSTTINTERLEVVLKIAQTINELMQGQANSMAKKDAFFEQSGRKLPEVLNKIYIKYFEPM